MLLSFTINLVLVEILIRDLSIYSQSNMNNELTESLRIIENEIANAIIKSIKTMEILKIVLIMCKNMLI